LDKKNQLKSLWKNSFSVTQSYTNLFFDYLYSDENVKFLERDGKIVSALYSLPYKMQAFSKPVKASYLCGVSTQQEYRGQGLVSTLIKDTLASLYNDGFELCALIPVSESLYSFYSRFDFAPVYKYKIIKKPKTQNSTLILKPMKNYQLCSDIHKKQLFSRGFSFELDANHFEFISKECLMFDELPLEIYDGDKFCGYIFYRDEDNIPLIREMLLENADEQDAINALCQLKNIEEVSLCSPCCASETEGLENMGMMRALNAVKLLEKIYFDNQHIEICDNIIKQNNGTYIFTKNGAVKTNKKAKNVINVCDIPSMICKNPYINMLLN